MGIDYDMDTAEQERVEDDFTIRMLREIAAAPEGTHITLATAHERALEDAIDRLRARQREGEREPVAWRVRYRRIGRDWTWFRLHADKAKAVQDVEHLTQNYKSVTYAEAVPLYTEPPADDD